MSFYQCKNCKKTWQHPIKECPDCFLGLQKITGEKFIVTGVCKVNIPTILHPKTPYFVLLLEDEKGNRLIYKSLKEYEIGDKFVSESAENKDTVVIWRVKYDILDAIERTMKILKELTLNENSKILILPSLSLPKHPYFSENTTPEFLEAAIQYFMKRGLKNENIKIASQSFNEFPIEISAQKSQLIEICSRNKIAPLDISKTNFLKKERNGITFEISEEAYKNDLIVNLPILKLDSETKLKGASDNLFKLLKKESYLSLKYLYSLPEIVKNVNELISPCLTLAEGISIQKSTGYTTFLGLLLASFNALNLDRVFAEIAMLKDLPEQFKDIKIEDIQVRGKQIEEVQHDVERF